MEYFDAGKIPIYGFGMHGKPYLVMMDPVVVGDIFTTKNKIMDKDGTLCSVFKRMLGDSFLFQKTDENWKEKRKASGHAFYKDRLEIMLEILRKQIM